MIKVKVQLSTFFIIFSTFSTVLFHRKGHRLAKGRQQKHLLQHLNAHLLKAPQDTAASTYNLYVDMILMVNQGLIDNDNG